MSTPARDSITQFNGRPVELSDTVGSATDTAFTQSPARGRSLYLASTGGHLAQLVRFAPRIDPLGEPLWVTFDSPQSRSLLHGQEVEFVRLVAPRDARSVISNLPAARRIFDDHDVLEVITTGSAIALSFVPIARMRSIPVHYIESAARTISPSITGRLVSRVPGVNLYAQYDHWSSAKWKPIGSIFDGFDQGPTGTAIKSDLTVAISLGTLPYRFDALVEAIKRIKQPEWRLIWQVGPNAYDDLPGEVHDLLDASQFADLCSSADVVVSHAGVGSALTALEGGRHPILVPRSAARREHVDDHQEFVAAELDRRGIASSASAGSLTQETVESVARRSVVDATSTQPPLPLARRAGSARGR